MGTGILDKMDLNFVLNTLLKILVATPGLLLLWTVPGAYGAALLGSGSARNLTDVSAPYYDYELTDSQELEQEQKFDQERIPDPSPLVLPGYNLPENIFNRGKPFYVEKDPLTGEVDFSKPSMADRMDEEAAYEDYEDPADGGLYDKANIDRKDGSISGHRPSDVNQLVPNFHDFLNLPVKYNSAKYVYPLISSSYASTKYQGSVNKFHNHKNYPSKVTTKKPLVSPTYYTTEKYFKVTYSTTTPSTTTTQRATTTTTTKRPETTRIVNLLNTGMGVGLSEEFDYFDTTTATTRKTTTTTKRAPTTTKPPSTTTTKKVMSLFEQLFGDYDDTVATTSTTTSTSTASTTPSTTRSTATPPTEPDVSYEYEDIGDNIAVESKPLPTTIDNHRTKNTTQPIKPTNNTDYYDYPEDLTTTTTTTTTSTTTSTPIVRVTSLPLGENHLTTSGYDPYKRHDAIIVATQNLRGKLEGEKVRPRPFEKPASANNVRIAPGQNTASFVLGDRQTVYGGPSKESPYDSNPFRPYYGADKGENEKEITLQGTLSFPEQVGSAVTIQPQRNSEASLAIGVPVNDVNKQIPGQVMDEKLDIDGMQGSSVKVSGGKVVFPADKPPEYQDLLPPPVVQPNREVQQNREVLQLNSKPMYHQLPSDLTPPKEQEVVHKRPIRPPWDPRPGHFYSGNPEYNRPPRPHTDVAYKRIDNLPNILPQFRPNTNVNKQPQSPLFYDKRLNRQPLLDRPSNRPMNFYEKLHPPPPPPPPYVIHKNLQALRKNGPPPKQTLDDGPGEGDQSALYQTPPQLKIANRRSDADVAEVETLQMIQAKTSEKKSNKDADTSAMVSQVMNVQADDEADAIDKTIYKVYPVNSAPIKLDVIDDGDKKEAVVIGTRSERPLPPSKINQDFDLLFDSKDRNDDPILKPHKVATFPVRSDFPYPLERPGAEPGINLPAVPDAPSKTGNDLGELDYFSNNPWGNAGENYESRIVNGNLNKISGPNQISVTLRTNSDKPIAVAYTPTEPNLNADKYSMPNYGSPVIPEIRPGDSNKLFTVGAVMHAHHPAPGKGAVGTVENVQHRLEPVSNHRNELDAPNYPKLDFEAPFQIENANQGWSVVKPKNVTTTEAPEATTVSYATTGEFDIENFKPQLEGGFKPIFNFPDDDKKFVETKINDREE
ncbi:unnamed protein product [Phyllotreta striolata]|uniref:Uncharacterized protein n=1 Tax=Phyllotreta striolata TaxID=444603 RepID=A0A9N9XS01_PHYSR|nr:unnamed protein product [Phyllotreta striolata]